MRSGNKLSAIVLFAIAALWCVCVLVFVDFSSAGFYYWGGLIFGLVNILIGAVTLFITAQSENRNNTEILMIPSYTTIAYALISIVFNGIYIAKKNGDKGMPIVIVNVLLIIAYIATVYAILQYNNRLNEQSEAIGNKIFQLGVIKTELATALAMCESELVKKKMLSLKQAVDYSNNLAQEVTYEEEEAFFQTIKQIETLIDNSASDDEICVMIDSADKIWKKRNSKLTSM